MCARDITSITKSYRGHSSIIEKESKIDVIYRGAWKWQSIGLIVERISEEKLY